MKLLCVIPEYPPDFGGGIATFHGALPPALARRGVSSRHLPFRPAPS